MEEMFKKEKTINELLDIFRDRVIEETKLNTYVDLVEKMNMFEHLDNTDRATAWASMKTYMQNELDKAHHKLEEIIGEPIPLNVETFEVKINE